MIHAVLTPKQIRGKNYLCSRIYIPFFSLTLRTCNISCIVLILYMNTLEHSLEGRGQGRSQAENAIKIEKKKKKKKKKHPTPILTKQKRTVLRAGQTVQPFSNTLRPSLLPFFLPSPYIPTPSTHSCPTALPSVPPSTQQLPISPSFTLHIHHYLSPLPSSLSPHLPSPSTLLRLHRYSCHRLNKFFYIIFFSVVFFL